jgi:hypothetical protein
MMLTAQPPILPQGDWCEGAKNKPGRRADRVMLIGSDPGPITVFLR